MKISKSEILNQQGKQPKLYRVTVKMTTFIPNDCFSDSSEYLTPEKAAEVLAKEIAKEGLWSTLSEWNFFIDNELDWEVEVIDE